MAEQTPGSTSGWILDPEIADRREYEESAVRRLR
jgi:hypothetical protein